jgi:hypothetical protein
MFLIGRAAVTPLVADPSPRAEQVTQLVLGEVARVLERRGEWLRARTLADDYAGWLHEGYVLEVDEARALEWRARAVGWSLGALLRVERGTQPVPLRARVVPSGAGVELPDGRWGAVVEGGVPSYTEAMAEARTLRPYAWAWHWFAGAPYLWGGVTPHGVDCSGLVQTSFAARGVALPRDAWQQASAGREVALDAVAPGDLLFFRGEQTDRITHVAIKAEEDEIVHATIACGAVVREPWGPGTRAAALRERLVGARRVEGP